MVTVGGGGGGNNTTTAAMDMAVMVAGILDVVNLN